MPAMDTQRKIEPGALQRYITTRVLPALGAQGGAFRLEPVKGGSRNLIWVLHLEGGGRYVLKALAKRFRIKNIIWAHAYLKRRAVPVPRLLFADRSWDTARAMGYYFACEEWIDGTALDELADCRSSHIDRTAGLFARMHAGRSFRWGKLKTFQVRGFRQYLLRKASGRCRALAESGCLVGKGTADSLAAWFRAEASAVRPLHRFSLCHGDVNMKNILLCPDGAIRLIDTEAFKFLPFQIEYYRLAYGLCGFDENLHRHFSRAYEAAAPKKNRQALERRHLLYHAYVLLEIAWHCNKKLKRPEGLTDEARCGFAATRSSALARLEAVLHNSH